MSIKYDKILGKIREIDNGSSSSSYSFNSGLTESSGIVDVKIDNNTIKFSGDTTLYVDTEEFWHTVPTNSGSTGNPGDFAYNNSYLYICVSTNTWKRIGYDSW